MHNNEYADKMPVFPLSGEQVYLYIDDKM